MTGILGSNVVRVAPCNASVASQRRVRFGNGEQRSDWPQKTGFGFTGHWWDSHTRNLYCRQLQHCNYVNNPNRGCVRSVLTLLSGPLKRPLSTSMCFLPSWNPVPAAVEFSPEVHAKPLWTLEGTGTVVFYCLISVKEAKDKRLTNLEY